MNGVSSLRLSFAVLLLFLLSGGMTSAISVQSAASANGATGAAQASRDPQKLFEAGEAALHAGKLDEAKRDFRQLLAISPGVAGGYPNLGVIHMRREQGRHALEMLHKAEKLAAAGAGIPLNIRLTYFPHNDFFLTV